MKIRILSWNLWYGTYLDKITNFIKNFNADIIGFQEATQTPEGKNKIAARIAKQFGYHYVYAPAVDARAWGKPFILGNAVLSKFPIISNITHYLSEEKTVNAVQADIKIHSKMLHIFCTHLKHTHQLPSLIQEEQARTLSSVIPDTSSIVMGDFNAIPGSKTVAIMKKRLIKADGNSKTPTWSVYVEERDQCRTNGVTIRLDYIFTTKDIAVISTEVEKSDGSDHLPISAIIEI